MPRINPTKAEFDALDDAAIRYIDVPYSSFTYNSTNKLFIAPMPQIPSGYEYAGAIASPMNGNCILGARNDSGINISVCGWIPGSSTRIDGAYVFVCTVILRKA